MMDGSGARSAEDWNNQSGSQHGCVEEGGTRMVLEQNIYVDEREQEEAERQNNSEAE